VTDPAVEYAYELCKAYWPGLPRRDFDAYSALGVDAAALLELEWDEVIADGPLLRWQDMSAADQLDRDRIRDFYEHGFGMIFELLRGIGAPGEMGAQDHRGNLVHQGMMYAGGHGPILDYGGGIGQAAIFLARQGWQVGYADLGETAAFARWRFEREGLLTRLEEPWFLGRVLVADSPEAALRVGATEVDEGLYTVLPAWGALSALDVVEHIPDPVALLQQFAGCLAPDGILFLTRHSFREYPAHLPETGFLMETLDDVLAGMGFRPVIPPDGHFGIGGWQR
jgi:SAM-dependent methyltransferase